MPATEPILAAFGLLGGVALFLFGMELMSQGLQRAAGHHLRLILQRLTASQALGLGGGTLFATFIHSGAVTLMVVGFINAGLVTFEQSIGVVLGANVGTAVSMQLISLNVGRWALAFVALGFWNRLLARREVARHLGTALLGLGVLFLGMAQMKAAMAPYGSSPWVASVFSRFSSSTWSGLLLGALVSTVGTTILQSSGAMIAIVYSLVAAGVVTSLDQAFPVIIGAHVGTCFTTLIGAVGTNAGAWRSAIAHLVFNVFSGVLFAATLGLYREHLHVTDTNLVRQIANANLIKQMVASAFILPFIGPFARFVRWMTPMAGPEGSTTHLDPNLVATPELAILAATKELGRQATIVRRMLDASLDAIVALDVDRFSQVMKEEEAVNAIKKQFDHYVVLVAERQISQRQSLMLQNLISASNDIERLGDHVKTLGVLTRTKSARRIWFDDPDMFALLDLGRLVAEMLSDTVDSLDPTHPDYRVLAERVLETRKKYKRLVQQVRSRFGSHTFTGADEAVAGMYYMRYVTVFDRMVKHLKTIAQVELNPNYAVVEGELQRTAGKAPEPAGPPPGHQTVSTLHDLVRAHAAGIPQPPDGRDLPLFTTWDSEE